MTGRSGAALAATAMYTDGKIRGADHRNAGDASFVVQHAVEAVA
jgi:hypothetical protein